MRARKRREKRNNEEGRETVKNRLVSVLVGLSPHYGLTSAKERAKTVSRLQTYHGIGSCHGTPVHYSQAGPYPQDNHSPSCKSPELQVFRILGLLYACLPQLGPGPAAVQQGTRCQSRKRLRK